MTRNSRSGTPLSIPATAVAIAADCSSPRFWPISAANPVSEDLVSSCNRVSAIDSLFFSHVVTLESMGAAFSQSRRVAAQGEQVRRPRQVWRPVGGCRQVSRESAQDDGSPFEIGAEFHQCAGWLRRSFPRRRRQGCAERPARSRFCVGKGCRMPSPQGSILRFAAILGCGAALAACSSPAPSHTEQPPGLSKELLKDKDDSLLRVAEVARDSADYPSAIRLYKTLLQNGDKRPEVHLGLADCLFLTGAYAEAAGEYHMIDEHSVKITEAEIGLGRVFLAQHKPAEANLEFDGALKHSPGDTRALNGAAVALDNLGQHEKAQIFYRRGLAIAPEDRILRNNYGLSLALSGNYAQAVGVLRPLVDAPGATARNRQNLALALALGGERAEAQKLDQVDLDTASVDNNLRFYDALRAAPAGAGATLPASAALPASTPIPADAPARPAAPAPLAPAVVASAAVPVPSPAQTAPLPAPVPLAPPGLESSAATPPAPAPAEALPAPVPQAPPVAVEVAALPSAPAPPPETDAPRAAAVPAPAAAALPAAPSRSAAGGPRPVESKRGGQFALQLAVYQKISGIAVGWQKYKSGFSDIVGALEPRVAMVDLGDGRGPLYRLKAGPFGSASAAEAACQKLKSAGSDCRVSDFDGAPAQEYWKEHQIE